MITITEPDDDPEGILLTPNSEGRYLSPEVKCSLYEKFTFSWINPLINKGLRKTLDENDIYELPDFDKASNVLKNFHINKKRSLLRSLFYTFRKELIVQFIYSVIWSIVLIFAPPYFLRKILLYVQNYPNNGDETQVTAYFYVIGLFLGTLIPSLCFQQALFIGRKLGIRTQAIIVGEVYLKSLSKKDTTGVTDNEETKNKTGKITNLMAVDAQKISELAAYIFYLYCFPLQIIICIILLYLLLGVSALVGVCTIIVTYPIPALINQRFATIHKRLMATTDKRIGVMNELLQAIRIIKFFAWEDQFQKKIIDARENELKEIKSRLMQWVYMGNIWMCLPLVIMLSVFMTYTKLLGNELSATVAFTALTLFNMLRHALDEGPSTIIAIIQARISVDRIENFLNESELIRQDSRPSSSNDPEIGFRNASFKWPDGSSSTDNLSNDNSINSTIHNKFTLIDLDIKFPVGKLSVICGPTGSGKTSLLMALLGELECLNGRVFLPRKVSSKNFGGAPSGIAYVAQTAWLQNASIKDNILFGLPFDEYRYNKVLNVCALNKDLEILEFGDKTEIGEKGITLSGGQKQRIALARAVYSQAKIIIMDDCLSAVDAHTAKHLYEKCLMGQLMSDRTLILVTHHVRLCLNGACKVVVMKDGRVVGQGTPSEILSQGLLEISEEQQKTNIESVDEVQPTSLNLKKVDVEGDGKLISEEERAEGIVDWNVYKIYFTASGGFLFWAFLILMFLITQIFQVGQDWWIREWSNAYTLAHNQIYDVASTLSSIITSWSFISTSQSVYNTLSTFSLPQLVTTSFNASRSSDDCISSQTINSEQVKNQVDVNYYISIYVLIGVLTALFGSIRTYYMSMGSLVASRKLHEAILDKVLKAKIRFFDTTPIGRILNRFSKDMEVVDQNLSPMAMYLIYSCMATASVIFAISLVMPQFLIAGAFIAILYIIIGVYYIATSRDLKRIESIKRSPIYAAFGETIVGVSTIRAFGAENKLMKNMFSLVDGNNRPFIFNWACNRWLNTRVDIVAGLMSLATGAIIIYRLSKGMDPGLAGFALTYALNFSGHLLWVLRMYALQEMNMNSVERIREYMELEEEPPRVIEGHRPPPEWPFKGEIKVNNLVMQYAPENPPVLKNVSFHIKPSEKVGIVGRTGSGKSTLALSFFRFMEPTSGQIIIDDIDISTFGLFDLRSRLTIIPQDPVLFSGTLRSNLDPFCKYDDVELWNALKRTHLIDEENKSSSSSETEFLEGGIKSNEHLKQNHFNWSLDVFVSENGSNFSQGQRQLIALARALVRRSKLIIMDEATASVDFKTDKMIQETIRQEFKDSTLLCIAHRIRTVVDYDKILVLDAGRIVEFDHPYLLIQNPKSVFRAMCEKSGEFIELVEIAKIKYNSDHS
ncbi:P-loop containing nucleoside triphosphate hydrolase protein [Glomus cerebriforme]|uniref:P-loop containing nucleoside triphosphate hydrolase protein n=1 Tax=Glomus cerebriforme TaxID=658196 RepID=A0A397T5D4_9GLOM|nr:P-loop containing nucleoside triphosphate hydrolase protein [Glomus cerebriforme]